MNKKFLPICLMVICIFLSACTETGSEIMPRREVSSYEEKLIAVNLPLQLDLNCDYGEMELYNWDKEQVKFEITRRIRGSEDKSRLETKLGKIEVNVHKSKKIISLIEKCRIQEGDYPDCCMVMRIYIPKRTVGINCSLKKGYMKFLDELKCNMSVTAGDANIEINSLEGRIACKSDKGWVRISAGELETGSEIKTGEGNIDVKANFIEGGSYGMDTENGMIRLKVSKELQAAFEYYGSDEDTVQETGILPAKFRLRSGMGKIEIIRT